MNRCEVLGVLVTRIIMLRGLVIVGLIAAGFGATQGWAQDSPFMRKKEAVVEEAADAPQEFEFNGIIKMGNQTRVCVTEIETKKTHWLEIGEVSNGIEAVSLHAEKHQLTIKQGGRTLTLSLKKPENAASRPTINYLASTPSGTGGIAASDAGIATRVAVTNEEKETEARFLVSDLLEIGMIQRKAYAEAKKKAQEEARAARAAAKASP